MDNDDVMCENALENAYNTIVKNDYPDLVQGNYYQISGENKISVIIDKPNKEWYDLTKDERAVTGRSRGFIPAPLWIKFIKLNIIKDNNIKFDKKMNYAQDSDFSMKLIRSLDKIVFADFFVVSYYHPRSGSISTEFGVNTIEAIAYFCYEYINQIQSWKISESIKNEAEMHLLRYARGMSVYAFNKSKADAKEIASLYDKYFKNKFRKLEPGDGQHGFLFKLYNLIGIKNTILLFNFYMRLKGINKKS